MDPRSLRGSRVIQVNSSTSMNLLFLTHSDLSKRPYGDGSTRYRSFNVAEVAVAFGHTAQVEEVSRLRLKDLTRFDLISWLRPVQSLKARRIIRRAKQLGIACVADVDDLIFDPHLAAESPAVCNGFTSRKVVETQFRESARLIEQFDAITVSTTALLEHCKRCFPQVASAVVRNGLSDYWLQHADRTPGNGVSSTSAAYLPGTRSHDQDFATICEPLSRWLKDASDRSLQIIGRLEYDAHRLPASQVEHFPWMDYYALPSAINRQRVTLAPLTHSQFNDAKSHIKFIESAALGVPLIARPIDDLTQHQCRGLLFADCQSQWYDALAHISEPHFLDDARSRLMDYARQSCTASNYTKPLIEAWEQGELLPTGSSEMPYLNAA